jgi:hypothetical protein
MPPSDYADVAGPLSDYIGELKKAERAMTASQLENRARAILAKIDESQAKHADALARAIQAACRKPPWDGSSSAVTVSLIRRTPASGVALGSRSSYTPRPDEAAPSPATSGRPER